MKAYKVEVILSTEQQKYYSRAIGVCRFVYNLFIHTNNERHSRGQSYMNNFEFSKWLNNHYVPGSDNIWIKQVSSKAVRKSIDNAHSAYQRFFKSICKFPRFKKKGRNDCNYYFTRTSNTQPIAVERHRIKIPCLGWIKLREYGYIPRNKPIISGTLSYRAGRYYISVVCDELLTITPNNTSNGIGIDLGIKDFAILSDGTKYITLKQKKLCRRLKHEQRVLSRKLEVNKNIGKGETTKGIERQKQIVARLHQRISNTRNDYQNKIIVDIINRKPKFITIENLNVKGMMKNRCLSKAIAEQGFGAFITKLIYKCRLNDIAVRVVDRFYPSSKLCSSCGCIKENLRLSDRVYRCDCGNEIDRDENAAINLRNAKMYKVV